MKILLVQLCLLLLLAVTGQVVSERCITPPDNTPYTLDVLEGVIPQEPYPQESSPSPLSYAHLINSDTKGYVIVNQSLSSDISKLSCSTQEIAVSVNVVLLREGYQPIIQIANPRHDLEGEMLLIAIDTVKGSVMLGYHHQGSPQVVHLPYKVSVKKWYHFVFVFSHNQFLLVQDCSINLVQEIPTPDLCLSESVTVSVGEVTYSNQVYIFQGALQNVILVFGNGGYTEVCPTLDTSCGTCAEVMQLNQRIAALEKERDDLQLQVDDAQAIMAASSELIFKDFAFFEDFRNHSFVDMVLGRSPDLNGVGDNKYNCYLQGQEHLTGDFFFHSFDENNMDVCCMCFFGTMICKGDVQRDLQAEDLVISCRPDFPLDTITTTPGTVGSQTTCTVEECGSITDPGPFTTMVHCGQSFDSEVCKWEMNEDRDKRHQYHAAVCCNICDPCEVNDCPDGPDSCKLDAAHGNHSCVCIEGKRFNRPNFECVDIDECMDRNICPDDSTCVNKLPGYECQCTSSGHRWDKVSECLDINECEEKTASCSDSKNCSNTVGGYDCKCADGYKENTLTGKCELQCSPPCQNGGMCMTNDVCNCTGIGFIGKTCEDDIDECKDGKMCSESQECLNTAGSYVCRCKPGYQSDGTACVDIDECAHSSLHHCDRGKCENVEGSYKCTCTTGKERYDCTGVCSVQNVDFAHNQTYAKKCKLCVCMHGLSVCTPVACDCSDPNTAKSQCCREQCKNCTLRDGSTLLRGTQGTTLDGCTNCNCKSNGGLNCVNLTCPSIDDCPDDLRHTPDGVCCPSCKVPTCDEQQQSMNVTIDNGCRKCSCDNGTWTCKVAMKCPKLSCDEEEREYESGQCCPKCRALSELGAASCL